MNGIVAYGAYVPYFRLARKAIADSLGGAAGRGTRAVASFDEDATSMAVEAARLATRVETTPPGEVWFATTAPPYLDKTNAAAVHAALGLPTGVAAYDAMGSVRSGAAALRAAARADNGLAVLSDVRFGLPGGPDERDGGDAAAAFRFGADGVVAELLATASSTAEFLDRRRIPGAKGSRLWEERFGEQAYLPLATTAVADALDQAGVTVDQLDHVVVSGLHARAVRRVAGTLGVRPDVVTDDLVGTIGATGAAQLGVLLADVLDRAEPGRLVLALVLADGADAFVLRTTDALPARRSPRPVRAQVAAGCGEVSYADFLTWRGLLDREPPRRPDPEAPAAPPSMRSQAWKFSFTGSRCEGCGHRHLPPQRVCVACHAVDRMVPERMADVQGTIATFTVDRLAFSLSPPVVVVVVDFDGGGRFQCELTDCDPTRVAIGDRVEMTFRRLYTSDDVHNYFWKARPIAGGEA